MSSRTAVGGRSGASERSALAPILASARTALNCAALIITRGSDEGPRVVATEGIDPDAAERALSFLRSVALDEDAPCAETLDLPGANCRSVDLGEASTMHVLRDAGAPLDVRLAKAFAAHCSTALRQRQRPRRLLSKLDQERRDEAFDGLALTTETMEDLVPLIEAAMATTFGQARVGVMVWDADRHVLQMVPGSFGAPESVTASYQIDTRDLHSNAARVFELGRPYLSNAARGDAGILQDYVDVFGIERLMSLPLAVAGRPTGVVHIADKASDFTGVDLDEGERLVPRIALATESTRMRMRLRVQQRLEGVLSEVAVSIASGSAIQSFLATALDRMRELNGATVVALVPLTADPIVRGNGRTPPMREQQLIAEARAVRREKRRVIAPVGAGNPGSAELHVPVRLGQQRIGTLCALRARGESFAYDERRGFNRMASLIALAWASERYQQQRAALARVEERQRIADDLHDDVVQLLFAAQMHLDTIIDTPGSGPDILERANLASALLTRGDTVIREVISQLSRPAASTVADRLTELVDSVEQEFSIAIHLEVSTDAAAAADRIGRALGDLVLRVAREALVNAAKHAGPCRLSATLDHARPGTLRLRVIDDGVGLPRSGRGTSYGLTAIRRAVRRHGGHFQVRAGTTGGTTVLFSIPLEAGALD